MKICGILRLFILCDHSNQFEVLNVLTLSDPKHPLLSSYIGNITRESKYVRRLQQYEPMVHDCPTSVSNTNVGEEESVPVTINRPPA